MLICRCVMAETFVSFTVTISVLLKAVSVSQFEPEGPVQFADQVLKLCRELPKPVTYTGMPQ